IAAAAGVSMEINDNAVPVTEPVRGACEILGLDPLYVANEGRFIAIISSRDLPLALETLHREPVSAGAVLIGNVVRGHGGQVTLQSRLGVPRVLDLLSGEQLPRIC
ncbi:MAG TPA: hydrogenase expression/formation protein HypE, partial [Verrucomicrobiales bacterium]|nr:hydrogenase expression/formation protein HypE [Verrucomicrobiales bacterium]